MSDLNAQRVVTFTKLAETMRGFADRQEARAPGRMDHITQPAQEAAKLAERIAAAYMVGDKAAASELRNAYAEHMTRHSFLQGL